VAKITMNSRYVERAKALNSPYSSLLHSHF